MTGFAALLFGIAVFGVGVRFCVHLLHSAFRASSLPAAYDDCALIEVDSSPDA